MSKKFDHLKELDQTQQIDGSLPEFDATGLVGATGRSGANGPRAPDATPQLFRDAGTSYTLLEVLYGYTVGPNRSPEHVEERIAEMREFLSNNIPQARISDYVAGMRWINAAFPDPDERTASEQERYVALVDQFVSSLDRAQRNAERSVENRILGAEIRAAQERAEDFAEGFLESVKDFFSELLRGAADEEDDDIQEEDDNSQNDNLDETDADVGGADVEQDEETRPIILDLDGNGISITELSQSHHYVDGGDGLLHRTSWAAPGDGVLFFDVDGDGQIKEKREYVFTEWDPTSASDLGALRAA